MKRTDTVILVRHARTPTTGDVLPGRAKGLHLSDIGAAEAEDLADRVHPTFDISAVYSSPLERAIETARPTARRSGQRVKTDRGLLECDFGEWTGQALRDLAKLPQWDDVQHQPSNFRFPGGESFLQMQTRIVDTINRLRAAHSSETIVVVSHADPLKAAVAMFMQIPLDAFQRLTLSPASVTIIKFVPTPFVLTLNHLGDLGDLRPS